MRAWAEVANPPKTCMPPERYAPPNPLLQRMEVSRELSAGARLGRIGGVLVALACAVLLVTAGAGAAKKKRAELVVTKLDDPPATLSAGDTLTISDKVKNRRGPKTKRSSNAYYLSVDPFRDQADFGLGSREVPKLKAKKSSRGKADLKVPNNTYTGTYRLLACADAEKKVKERSESNNCRESKGDVFIAGIAPPDTSPPNAPAITDTEPDPPASERTIAVKGNAEPGSTVRIFAGSCSGNSIGRGSAGVFASAGVTVTVPANETTRLRATATDDAGNESGCSAPFAYTHDPSLPPAPTITTVPGVAVAGRQPSGVGERRRRDDGADLPLGRLLGHARSPRSARPSTAPASWST